MQLFVPHFKTSSDCIWCLQFCLGSKTKSAEITRPESPIKNRSPMGSKVISCNRVDCAFEAVTNPLTYFRVFRSLESFKNFWISKLQCIISMCWAEPYFSSLLSFQKFCNFRIINIGNYWIISDHHLMSRQILFLDFLNNSCKDVRMGAYISRYNVMTQ